MNGFVEFLISLALAMGIWGLILGGTANKRLNEIEEKK